MVTFLMAFEQASVDIVDIVGKCFHSFIGIGVLNFQSVNKFLWISPCIPVDYVDKSVEN